MELIGDAGRFHELRGEWSELLAQSAADCLFLSWEWLYTWWTHLSGGRQLYLLAVWDGGTLIGLAPLAVRPWQVTRLRMFRALEFMGTGPVGSDYLDVIIRRGREPEVTEMLAAELTRRGALVELVQVKGDVSLASAVATRLATDEWQNTKVHTGVCPYVRLAEHSWDSYLSVLRPKHRDNVRRCLRQLASRFDVSFRFAETDAERRTALTELLTLHGKRWRTRGGSTAFCTPALLAFHEDVSHRALESGWLRLAVLRLNGVSAAAFYGFRYKRSFYFYQSGFDPDYARYSVGVATLALTIKSAFAEGADEYDFLHGDESYKFLWTQSVRELYRLELFPPDLRGWLYRGAVETDRAVRRLARRVLPHVTLQGLLAVGRREDRGILEEPPR
ncbi:MAG TPA: GNAT family N-acetyltransferase [bacterium]|nr:GNAT family N-acetyltransferase [bacterium]